MEMRASAEEWKLVESIQSCVKSLLSVGKLHIVRYFANLDEDDPSAEIKYSITPNSEDLGPIPKNALRFSHLVLERIAFYVSKIYNYEILKMKAEFLEDGNSQVWLSYITEIVTRVKKGHTEHFDIIPGLSVCILPGKQNIFKTTTVLSPKAARQQLADTYQVNFPSGRQLDLLESKDELQSTKI